ncbi:MAG TPA: site-specific DNA-methyltransferase [Nitrospirae bacterium]|nr:site-specific DNA-methyltransferase [Nitrospirota bacterium]HDZ01077.1 site-specific DNA-methyltransferase [Nitrospirota bacterium]
MNFLPDKSVHLVITSPPYWQLKDYGTENQIGFHESYESYINNLNLVWKESFRVLHPGCRLCINIGDQFARSVYYGRYKVIPIRTEIIKFCETTGFDYMGAVIWQKVTTTNTTGGATIMGSFPYPRNGILKLDYEFILLFKKQGIPPKPTKEQKELSAMTKDEWNTYFSGHWYFAGAKQDGHIAVFPEELPARLIKMFAFAGDTVLDPFLGSGTTSLAARNLCRNSIGYEINADFISIVKEKLNINQSDLAETEYVFLTDSVKTDLNKEIENLPYIFKDPHKLDKKIDLKKLKFGSKIDKNSGEREVYYSVKEVISPELIKLNNNLIVRLLGVKENKSVNGQAIKFLLEKTKGQKVFMKFDNQKYDERNNLLCYLYLKNKTFINAHIIKAGLADVDGLTDFKYKDKFLNFQRH